MTLEKLKDLLSNLLPFDDSEVEFLTEGDKEIELMYIAIDQLSTNTPKIVLRFTEKRRD